MKLPRNTIPVAVQDADFIDVLVELPPTPVQQRGVLRTEFRLDGEMEPTYVTTLQIVDAPFSIVPTQPPGAAASH